MRVLLKLTWIEIKLLAREPVTLLFSFAFPVLVLVLLGGIFGDQHMKMGAYKGVKMMNWYVPSYIALVIASIGTISLPVHLSSYRERGVLRRFRASGVSEAALLGSQLLVSLGVAFVGALTITILGGLAYGARLPASPAEVALAYVVGVFCFAAVGVLLASLAPTARAAQSVGLLLWFVMLFVSGTSAPLDLLPSWMVDIGKALPLYHSVLAVVDPWIGRGTNWTQLAIVATVGVVATLVSLRVFRWE
ncbi:MAG: ABC transporter permease [Actinobacteria bacterium]|nr:ABC transporter permease [Actinomycetota bacterium]